MERNFPAAKRQYGLGYRKGDRRDSQAEPLAKGPPWGTFSQGAVPISAVGKAVALPNNKMVDITGLENSNMPHNTQINLQAHAFVTGN